MALKAFAALTLAAGAGLGLGYHNYVVENRVPSPNGALDPLPAAEMPKTTPAGGLINLICPANIPNCTPANALAYAGEAEYEPLGDQPIADTMSMALICREDVRYVERDDAADTKALFRAAKHDFVGWVAMKLGLKPKPTWQGASTIEMDDASWRFEGMPRENLSLKEKAHEIQVARRMEQDMPGTLAEKKVKIERDFMDRIDYGRNARGIVMASRKYFGTTPNKLTIPQAAVLAGLIRAPSRMDDYASSKEMKTLAGAQSEVLRDLIKCDPKHANLYTPWLDHRLHPLTEYVRPNPIATRKVAGMYVVTAAGLRAQYFVADAKKEAEALINQKLAEQNPKKLQKIDLAKDFIGARVVSTLVGDIQQRAVAAVDAIGYHSGDPELALTFVDPSGAVQAVIGGRGNSEYNLADALRQVGSSDKPFFLAVALMHGETLDTRYPEPETIVIPKVNNGEDYPVKGKECAGDSCSLKEFVAKSSNIVAVQVAQRYGVSAPFEIAKQLGLDVDTSYVPFSSVLGTLPSSTRGLATAYNSFILNHGQTTPSYTVDHVTLDASNIPHVFTTGDQVVPHNITVQVAEAMKAVVHDDGTGRTFHLDEEVDPNGFAAKTGTTENNADARFTVVNCLGVVSVWEGFPDRNTPMPGHFGAGTPTEVATNFLRAMPLDPNCVIGNKD